MHLVLKIIENDFPSLYRGTPGDSKFVYHKNEILTVPKKIYQAYHYCTKKSVPSVPTTPNEVYQLYQIKCTKCTTAPNKVYYGVLSVP